MPKIRSDLQKVDAHIIQPHEYDEAPELTDEEIATAVVVRQHKPKAPDREDEICSKS